jgi:pyruvate/oxaloacetate carboxyltransferase
MDLYYNFDCHIPMALAAHEGTSTTRMNKAINACRTGLDRIRTDASAIATRAALPAYGADMTALCQPHSSRQDRAACEAIVSEAATDCQKEAMASLSANTWKASLDSCWSAKKAGLSKNLATMIAVRTGVSVPQTPAAPSGPLVPANPVLSQPKGRGN